MLEQRRIAVVGMGKIARDQHIPAIAESAHFALAATIDPVGDGVPGIAHFPSLQAMVGAGTDVCCAAVCTPPQVRYGIAREALAAGFDLLLEKPPCGTLADADALAAACGDRLLFAAWHSRYAAAIEPARQWLAGRIIRHIEVRWRENVNKWHPGQDWIFADDGLGVFDPAINALSILTCLVPGSFGVEHAALFRPQNRAMPISGTVVLSADAVPDGIHLDLDFLEPGDECWDIDFHMADGGMLQLRDGGAVALADMVPLTVAPDGEYQALYCHFASLLDRRESDFHVAPLRLALDAIGHAPMREVAAFHF